jgi:hypothetical protein
VRPTALRLRSSMTVTTTQITGLQLVGLQKLWRRRRLKTLRVVVSIVCSKTSRLPFNCLLRLPSLAFCLPRLPSLTATHRRLPSLTVAYRHSPSLTVTHRRLPSLTVAYIHSPFSLHTSRNPAPLELLRAQTHGPVCTLSFTL